MFRKKKVWTSSSTMMKIIKITYVSDNTLEPQVLIWFDQLDQ